MGSLLAAKGLELTCGTHNLDHPQVVKEVHREYIEAGSNCIITNTLTLNAIYTAKKGMDLDLYQLNKKGAEIAREAAEDQVYVLGDLGPTGDLLEPLGIGKRDEFLVAFTDQARALADGGVDGFIIETIFDLNEALLALEACRSVSDLPIIVSLTFSSLKKGGTTFMGNTAAQCVKKVYEAGGSAVGANCGDLDPEELSEVVKSMTDIGLLPVSVQPNAGKPIFNPDGIVLYNMTPEDYLLGMRKSLANGAQILGGCCGTTPQHIRLLAKLLQE
ncbi:MAG: homocysteine S-methyltransferase family protein, partial [Clostridiales bacterium]